MKVTVQSDGLLGALQTVGPSVATKGTLPILKHVVIEASNSTIIVAGTNQEQSSHAYVGGGIDEYGAIAVPYKPLITYLKAIPKGAALMLERDWRRESLVITHADGEATLYGTTAAQFPNLPGIFDPAECERRDEREKAILAEERKAAEERELAEWRAERERIAALPDRFTYTYQVGGVGKYLTNEFDTLREAVTQWHSDHEGDTRELNGAVRWGCWIIDKFGEKIVNGDYQMRATYGDYQADDAKAEEDARVTPQGPPPGIPCEPAGWAVAEENAIADVIGDIPVDFAPSVRVDVPLQQQEQMQHDSLAEKVERVRAAVVAIVPPKPAPRVTKLRFGYRPETIERFFARAIRAGATVKVANLVKHEGNLIEYTPVYVNEESYVVRYQGGEPFPVNKANIRYLEAVC